MHFERIKKRDGRIVPFDKRKIATAVLKAMEAVKEGSKEDAEIIANEVVSSLKKAGKTLPSVEEVQDLVEEILMKKGYYKVAKAYILYRALHNQIRELVDGYLYNKTWLVKENANMTFSLQGLNTHIFSQVVREYWLHRIYLKRNPEIAKAHINGDFHLHDLQILGPYCVGWDLRDLLLTGFTGVRGKITSRPAKHFRVALLQVVNFLYTLQGEAAGAQAFSNFDTLLAPFIRYDNLSYQKVKQALQEFMFNMNVPTRVGFQTPFTNITLDLKIPRFMENEPVIIGGRGMNETYGDFQEEMDAFNRALAEIMLEGDGVGRVFTFPIPTINITKDFDWESEVIKKVFETSAKYGIPYFANFVNSDMKPEDVRSMCLHPAEEIIIRNSGKILRFSIENLVENYADKFDEEGWAVPKKKVEVLSVNPETLEVEWKPVIRFLRKRASTFVRITTSDGKTINVTPNHPVVVLSRDGMKIKFAREIKKDDVLLSLRSGRRVLKNEYQLIPLVRETRPKLSDEQLKKLHALGLSDSQIAYFSGMHKDQVGRRRRKLGLKPNSSLRITKNELMKIKTILSSPRYLPLDEKLAAFLGIFTADGNYLFNYRDKTKVRGIQFTLNLGETNLKKKLRLLAKEIFGAEIKERKDPRYNTVYLYIYDTALATSLYLAGFRKYGKLPQILFNSPPQVIESFITHFFLGDGYKKRREIHINDRELARDLVILCSLIGMPVCYREMEKSQRIYFQKRDGNYLHPSLYEMVPGWAAKSTFLVPGLNKKRMVGIRTLEKYNAVTETAEKLVHNSVAPVRVKRVEKIKLNRPVFFYDVELKDNHIFVHSLGTITHNCCRLRIDKRELKKRGGGLFGANPLTGSIAVVTINMPRIGYLSKEEHEFFERLEKLMELAKESLEIKRKVLEEFTERGLYPYSKFYLRNIKQGFGEYWKNHFSTIGLIGMNEACLNFLGCGIGEKDGHRFAIKVLDFMRSKLMEFQEETGNIYNLEATPGEGTSYRLAKIDKSKYPNITVANEKDVKEGKAAPYYTNSTWLPVYYTDDLWELLRHQDPLQTRYTGGTVVHVWLGERATAEGVMALVRKVFENFKLPYISVTPTFSVCPAHGYIAGEHAKCPNCGRKTEVYSRVVGYLRPVDQYNPGKQAEFKQRKMFDNAFVSR